MHGSFGLCCRGAGGALLDEALNQRGQRGHHKAACGTGWRLEHHGVDHTVVVHTAFDLHGVVVGVLAAEVAFGIGDYTGWDLGGAIDQVDLGTDQVAVNRGALQRWCCGFGTTAASTRQRQPAQGGIHPVACKACAGGTRDHGRLGRRSRHRGPDQGFASASRCRHRRAQAHTTGGFALWQEVHLGCVIKTGQSDGLTGHIQCQVLRHALGLQLGWCLARAFIQHHDLHAGQEFELCKLLGGQCLANTVCTFNNEFDIGHG